jgi:hypothetical protein
MQRIAQESIMVGWKAGNFMVIFLLIYVLVANRPLFTASPVQPVITSP